MVANVEMIVAVHKHTHTILLEDRNFASFLISKINLIIGEIINRANFLYIFRLQLCNFCI